jgi:dynein heavy chain
MAHVHLIVREVGDEYFAQLRRRVHHTPRTFISFLVTYKVLYARKLHEMKEQEARVTLGLKRLIGGAEAVATMKITLHEEREKLEQAAVDTTVMLGELETNSHAAKTEGDSVGLIKAQCEQDAARILLQKQQCEADLGRAQPFVEQANAAIDSIKPADITEVKGMKNPADVLKLVFDGVMILFMKSLSKVAPCKLTISKKSVGFVEPSFKQAVALMQDPKLLKNIHAFSAKGGGKDKMNEETIELLQPYLALKGFDPGVAKKASKAGEGLCIWVQAMNYYHEASKIVKPKLEALAMAEGEMEAANTALAAAEQRLDQCQATLAGLQAQFQNRLGEKKRMEANAALLTRKMTQAAALIDGLAGERSRWTKDAKGFASSKKRLLGDVAVTASFLCYLGPFNQQFRAATMSERLVGDCELRHVPVTAHMDVAEFLVDAGTVGDWNQEGLPTDRLSVQNGILVTQASRYPLLVDPQGQALHWVRSREEGAKRLPAFGTTSLAAPKLRDQLEYCLAEGKALIVTGVEDVVDSLFDPVLDKNVVVKAKSKHIVLAERSCEFDDAFALYLVTRLPNPHFSPETQARCTVVDFTVTQQGLEEQLLGRVIGREQKALEEQLEQVLSQLNDSTKLLRSLDGELLERLTANDGDLLQDVQLVGVLHSTKAKAKECADKLLAADETKASINEKREQFRPAATRGAVLFFSIVEISASNPMYQTSLDQFLALFLRGMAESEKASLASKRVGNIVEAMTRLTFRYVSRGLFEQDKLAFSLLLALKILLTAQAVAEEEVSAFLRGGSAIDPLTAKPNPFPKWLGQEAWLNVLALTHIGKSQGGDAVVFRGLVEGMVQKERAWREWCGAEKPEALAVPDAALEDMLAEAPKAPGAGNGAGAFRRLLLLRALRVDRSAMAARGFLRGMPQLGPQYVDPVADTVQGVFAETLSTVPVIFLLSRGADPTDSIELLARKRRVPSLAVVSLGEGQEPVAIRAINAAAQQGAWVLLQNCELGLGLMREMEALLARLYAPGSLGGGGCSAAFRLFFTALPSAGFPLGLLQMCTKVTNEPPAGLRAGMVRSYTATVDQEKLERVDSPLWRTLLFNLCFLHSIVQERRKFGPLGWCIPYEFNTGDLTACALFLEKHLYTAGEVSWPTLQYMVSSAQYGGKITDAMDQRLFQLYTEAWLCPASCEAGFAFNGEQGSDPELERLAAEAEALAAAAVVADKGGKGGKAGAAAAEAAALAEQARAAREVELEAVFRYRAPDAEETDIEAYRRHCAAFPAVDEPELFGLHANADLSFRVKEANALLAVLNRTQPTAAAGGGGSGGGGDGGGSGGSDEEGVASGPTMEDQLQEKAAALLAKLPKEQPPLPQARFLAQLEGKARRGEKASVPLGIFLFQEMQRLRAVVGRARKDLRLMQQAARGEVVVTGELQVRGRARAAAGAGAGALTRVQRGQSEEGEKSCARQCDGPTRRGSPHSYPTNPQPHPHPKTLTLTRPRRSRQRPLCPPLLPPQRALDAILAAAVPTGWLSTPGGDEFSWLTPLLGQWFASLLKRDEQYRLWTGKGRLAAHWLGGYFNPAGFLTGMKQDATRLHAAEKWALDDMVYMTEVRRGRSRVKGQG